MKTIVLALVLLAGCPSFEDVARESFSKEESCPLDRVTAVEKPGMDAHELTFGKDAEPSSEIQKDPARYAMWKKEREEAHAQWNKAIRVVEVKGCDKDVHYTCGNSRDSNGGTSKTCSKVTPRMPDPSASASASASAP